MTRPIAVVVPAKLKPYDLDDRSSIAVHLLESCSCTAAKQSYPALVKALVGDLALFPHGHIAASEIL